VAYVRTNGRLPLDRSLRIPVAAEFRVDAASAWRLLEMTITRSPSRDVWPLKSAKADCVPS